MTNTNESKNSAAVRRILVVDTDVNITDIIRSQFAGGDYIVDECRSTRQLFSIELSGYSLIIIDLDIDNNSGLGIVEQIRQRPETSRVGVIATSVNMSPATIINALSAGADDYLLKPFSMRELQARARSIIRGLEAGARSRR